jgi:hypothetical protein
VLEEVLQSSGSTLNLHRTYWILLSWQVSCRNPPLLLCCMRTALCEVRIRQN